MTTTSPRAELPAGDERTLDDAAIERYAEQVREAGWVVVPDAIDSPLADAISDDLLRLERELGIVPADNLFEGLHTSRIYNLLAHGALYERIPVHPNVLPIVEKVLDPGLLISSLSSIAIGPDENAQPIHATTSSSRFRSRTRRSSATPCGPSPTSPRRTAPPGCVPGPTRPTTRPTSLEHYDSIPAEMAKGSVLVWVGSLWHGGGANQTDPARSASP